MSAALFLCPDCPAPATCALNGCWTHGGRPSAAPAMVQQVRQQAQADARAERPSTPVPADLTDPQALAALLISGLHIIADAGLWDTLPAAARERFGAALMPSLMVGPAKQVADIAKERDDERALSNMLLARVNECDATIRSLRAEIAALPQKAAA